MRMYRAFGPDAEVFGKAILASAEAINFKLINPILERHQLTPIQTEHWYPQQLWLDVFNDLVKLDNSIASYMISIGIKMAEIAYMPPKVEKLTFEQAMMGLPEYYYWANHRGANIGFLDVEMVGKNHLMVIDGTPYPDGLIYGVYYGMTRRFLPKGRPFTVRYDEKEPRRETGGALTIIHIKWE